MRISDWSSDVCSSDLSWRRQGEDEMLRKWVGAAGAALALQPGAVVAQGALGANFNEHYEDVDYRELDSAGAQWIRLFLPMPQVDRGAAEQIGRETCGERVCQSV